MIKRRTVRVCVLMVLVSSGIAVRAAEIGARVEPAFALPATSAGRAERTLRWSHALSAADNALLEGRTTEAEALLTEVIAEAGNAATPNLLLARALDGLADLYRIDGRFAEAEPLYLRSAALLEDLLGPTQPRLATTLHNLGMTCLAEGRRALARGHLQRALGIWEVTLGIESTEARNTRRALARLALDPPN